MTQTPDLDTFITRWAASGAAERANYQLFLSELCDLLGVERPRPATDDPSANAYVFEKPVPLAHGTTGFIDLYRRGCFVLEAKQGSAPPRPLGEGGGEGLSSPDPQTLSLTLSQGAREPAPRGRKKRGTAVRGTAGWDTALERARAQAQTYARSLPPGEIAGGRPPFLIVVDVGNTIDLYSEFTRSGGNYVPFPDPHHFRLRLDDLRDEASRDLLRAVWDTPLSLDPARRSARVTRAIAERLAELAKTLEQAHDADTVAHFLMRCLFTMFAEDVGLLPEGAFTQLLADLRPDPVGFKPLVEHLWHSMNTGGFSVALRRPILRFNGGLFADPTALPLDGEQIALLIDAARADWRDVEPAIFGTLLERALDPRERHKLGAHYTPRAYVERLVEPTVIAPLRGEWAGVQAAALRHHQRGDDGAALAEVEAFLHRLAHVTVLDPACGSGNFLYVTLEQMKRLEGEALNLLRDLGGAPRLALEGFTVTPQQFRGIEVNPRAAAIAELVLWIGYLQWHRRTRGEVAPAEPIIRDFHNIERRDAVLAWDRVEPLTGPDGRPVTRWDGRTTKRHPATGELVPDEAAQTPVWRYVNPRPAAWPAADFVVGNPPFIGAKRMRDALGDDYIDALMAAWPEIPQATDYVTRWWHKAATLVRNGNIRSFGLITTNSLSQAFNRRAIEPHLNAVDKPLSLSFAVADHPWVDSTDGAAVRISMTAAIPGRAEGTLLVVAEEHAESASSSGDLVKATFTRRGIIHSDLTVGVDVSIAKELEANYGLCAVGMKTIGSGFILNQEEALHYGVGPSSEVSKYVRPYLSGRDFASTTRGVYVIDFFGLTENEVRSNFPELYQHLLIKVKPFRDVNRNRIFREQWWVIGHPRPVFREFTRELARYVVTIETAKHRYFAFVPSATTPDSTLVTFGFDDAYYLGVLSSTVHVTWALATGGTLEDRPRYNKTRCFETFPFPDASDTQRAAIRTLAEQLDAHRKRQQALHPRLTLTDMYNVLAKLRAGEALNEAERRVHEQGLVAILRQLHDELDLAVLEAYGWGDLIKKGLSADLADSADLRSPEASTLKSAQSAQSADHSSLEEAILERLVALNAARAAEEGRGVVRWLRPAYQMPRAGLAPATQPVLPGAAAGDAPPPAAAAPPPWPDGLAARAAAVRAALGAFGRPAKAAEVAAAFAGRADKKRVAAVAELLATLVALGQAGMGEEGEYVGN